MIPDLALTLVLVAIAGCVLWLKMEPKRRAQRWTAGEMAERFPGVSERIRQRHFH